MTQRTPWSAIPQHVQEVLEARLGAPIIGVSEASAGFSPAIAATVELAGGIKRFVKACTPSINQTTMFMQRHEAMVVSQLPPEVPTPQLVFSGDIDEWQVLVFEYLDAQPVTDPFAHMRGIDALYDTLGGVRINGLAHVLDDHQSLFTSWAALSEQVPGLGALVELESQVEFMRFDDSLMHGDGRDDNALVGADGRHYFVDWACACHGPGFIDAVGAVSALHIRFDVPVADLVASSRLIAERSPHELAVFVAGFAGYLANFAHKPAPPNMPTLRAFQYAQAGPMLTWLQQLVGDRIVVPSMDDITGALSKARRDASND
ncbi:MAG: phosphotransferase [Acidimicrobiia bacterium]